MTEKKTSGKIKKRGQQTHPNIHTSWPTRPLGVAWDKRCRTNSSIFSSYSNFVLILGGLYGKGAFKYHITLFWTFADPSPLLSHTILILWFNPPPQPFSRVRIHIVSKFVSDFSGLEHRVWKCVIFCPWRGSSTKLIWYVPWVVGFQKKCLPYLAPCSGPLETIRKLVARFFG